MFLFMGRWLGIWAAVGLALAGAAHFLAPPTPDHYHVRLVVTFFPWAALWAALVAHAPLPMALRRVHHVTTGAVLALFATCCLWFIARDTGRLTPLSIRVFLLTGMAAGLFALFGTTWAVSASRSWRRTRRSGVLADPRLA